MSATEERYVFECEWFDELASLIRKYLFTYYPKNSTVEMVSKLQVLVNTDLIILQFDLKTRKMFLKRMACADISEDKLFIGSIVTIFSRQLKLVDYGDTFTRNHFAQNKETTFGLIKPDVYVHTGKIIDMIYQNGFTISRLRMGKFGPSTTQRFLQISNQQNAETSQLL